MKSRSLLKLSILAMMFVGIALFSCKKDKDDEKKDEEVSTTSMQQLSKDEGDFQTVTDDAEKEVNDVVSAGSSRSGLYHPANAVVVDTIIGDTLYYEVTYNGLNSKGNRSRTGVIEFKMNKNTAWKDAGTQIFAQFKNFKVTKVLSGKSLILNGTKKITNVSGGKLSELGTSGYEAIVHNIEGSIQATFDDNTTRTWQIARTRTFSGALDALVITVSGFGKSGSYENLVAWGTNRHGELFYTQVSQDVVFKETCEWNPTSGVKTHQIPSDNKIAKVTFGFDDSNNPVPLGNCATKYQVQWTKGDKTGTLYLPLAY